MNNFNAALRVLKRADAKRALPRMTVAFCRKRNAADLRFRTRPSGLPELHSRYS